MMIKQEFCAKYTSCAIQTPSEYQLGNATRPVVFCVDCIFRMQRNATGKRCDEFIFFDLNQNQNQNQNITGIYLVERKTNISDVTKVKAQLQGGATFVCAFLNNDPALDSAAFDFMPVWVSKGISPSARRKLITAKISLRNKTKHIYHVKNRQTLPKICIS